MHAHAAAMALQDVYIQLVEAAVPILLVVLALFLAGSLPWFQSKQPARSVALPAHEIALLLALLSLPAICYAAALLGHTNLNGRYAISFNFGFSVAVAYLIHFYARRSPVVATTAFVVGMLMLLGKYPRSLPQWAERRPAAEPVDLF